MYFLEQHSVIINFECKNNNIITEYRQYYPFIFTINLLGEIMLRKVHYYAKEDQS